MAKWQSYAFTQVVDEFGDKGLRPHLPITLRYVDQSIATTGLLDTGATVNVLPYSLGVALGANWNEQQNIIRLTGNLGRFEARGLIVDGIIAQFPPVRLVFAWTRTDDAPLILGDVNFLLEFEVCYFRKQNYFELRPTSAG